MAAVCVHLPFVWMPSFLSPLQYDLLSLSYIATQDSHCHCHALSLHTAVSCLNRSLVRSALSGSNQSESSAVPAVFWHVLWPLHSRCSSLALIYHWYCTNTAEYRDPAVDHAGFRLCADRGWVDGLKGWPASILTRCTGDTSLLAAAHDVIREAGSVVLQHSHTV